MLGILGSIDVIADGCVSGWAWDPAAGADKPLTVEIRSNGALLATVVADRFRQDLLKEGIGSGFHSFAARLPAEFADVPVDQITARAAGVELTNRCVAPRRRGWAAAPLPAE